MHKKKRCVMSRSGVSGGGAALSRVDEPPFEKGDRVWVMSGHGLPLPGVVIDYHADWDLYRVVYMDDIAERNPSAVHRWRLFPRSAKREDALEAKRGFDESLGRSVSGYDW
jgi:hypothetical protein